MMAEYISKDKFIHFLFKEIAYLEETQTDIEIPISATLQSVVNEIKKFTSEDVQPVKHGKWDAVEVEDVSTKSNLPITTIASMWCNQCNRFHNEIYYYGNPTEYANYCPHCGARMDGET